MKGLLLSLAALAGFVVSSVMICHGLRPRRHGRVFWSLAVAWIPLYGVLYGLTPPDLGCLGPAWQAALPGLDAIFGLVVYLLNAHSFIDFFFGFNGGFSMSLLLALHHADSAGLTSAALAARYRLPDGTDKIYSWRLPALVAARYLICDPASGRYRLTPKGRRVASLTQCCKRLLALGPGG